MKDTSNLPRKGRRGDASEGAAPAQTWGWGVRLEDPKGWLGPEGELPHAFWWGRRGDAERLALRFAGLGRSATIVHASRLKSCTSPARAADPFGRLPGREGDAAALLELLRAGVVQSDRQRAAVSHLQRLHPGASIEEAGEVQTQWVRDELCTLARDSLRNDPKLAARLLRAAGKGECRTAEATKGRMVHEAKRARSSAGAAAKERGLKTPRKKR